MKININYRKIIIFLGLFFACAALYSSFVQKRTNDELDAENKNQLAAYLKENNWRISFAGLERDMEIAKAVTREKYSHNATIVDANFSDKKIKVEKISGVDDGFAGNFFSDKVSYIESNYVQSLSAYPEVITNTIECPPEFKPKKYDISKDNIRILEYDFLTNDRSTYGVCSKDLVTHRGLSISVYCPHSKEIYNADFYAPLDKFDIDPEKIFNEINCKE